MKKIILISLVVFTIYSFTSDNSGFEPVSQKELMKSWAWKIFIFIDEGEIHPVKPIQRSAYKNKNERIYEDDYFLNNEILASKEQAVIFFEKVNKEK